MERPLIASGLKGRFDVEYPGWWDWYRKFLNWLNLDFKTEGDITFQTAAKGIVLKNAAGTVTKRVRLNDLGDGLIFEDL